MHSRFTLHVCRLYCTVVCVPIHTYFVKVCSNVCKQRKRASVTRSVTLLQVHLQGPYSLHVFYFLLVLLACSANCRGTEPVGRCAALVGRRTAVNCLVARVFLIYNYIYRTL